MSTKEGDEGGGGGVESIWRGEDRTYAETIFVQVPTVNARILRCSGRYDGVVGSVFGKEKDGKEGGELEEEGG
jgi:hypothetical protein